MLMWCCGDVFVHVVAFSLAKFPTRTDTKSALKLALALSQLVKKNFCIRSDDANRVI